MFWSTRCAYNIWSLTRTFGDSGGILFLEFMDLLWYLIFTRECDDDK